MKRILQYIDMVNIVFGHMVSLSIILIVICVALEILLRMLTGRPLDWTYETSLFLFGGYSILLGGYAYLNDSHVRMDFFYGRMSTRMQAIMDLVTFPLFLFFTGVFLWMGVNWVEEAWNYQERSQSLWGPSLVPIKLTIPLGFFILMVAGISKFIKKLTFILNYRKGHHD